MYPSSPWSWSFRRCCRAWNLGETWWPWSSHSSRSAAERGEAGGWFGAPRPPAASRPSRGGTVGAKIGPPEASRIAAELARWLEERGVHVDLDIETSRALRRRSGAPRDLFPRG